MATVVYPAVSRPSLGISQNSVIFAALLIGFLIYIILKGRLAAYVGLLFKSQARNPPQQTPTQSPSPLQPIPALPELTPLPSTFEPSATFGM